MKNKLTSEERTGASSTDVNLGIAGAAGGASFDASSAASAHPDRGQIDRERRVETNVQPTETESRDADYESSKK